MLMRIPGQHYENVRSPSSISLLAKEGLVSLIIFIVSKTISKYKYLRIVLLQTDVTWRDMTVHKLMQEYGLEFEPNFDKHIFLIIHEAELMERLGNTNFDSFMLLIYKYYIETMG